MPTIAADDPSPRTTARLLGHQAAERAFLDAWSSGRLAHSWLICGPRGIGKATLAFRIARFVLASGRSGQGMFDGLAPASLDMAENHPVFRRVASGGHADFKLVERTWSDDKQTRLKSEIAVDDVRDVGAFLSLTPAEGGWRVVIVDATDDLNRSGANALLKVLEEPPSKALLLLVSHTPGRLLPTILSRCRRLTLKPLADDVVAELLRRHCPALAEDDAASLAKLAQGSVGKGLGLAVDGGLELYRDMIDLLTGLPTLDAAALHAFADRVARSDASFRLVGELLAWWLADAAAGAARRGSADRLAERLVSLAGIERWVDAWERIGQLFERAEAVNLDHRQVVLNAFLVLDGLFRQVSART
jgi:DNA polymerase-3 subunit delta'